MQPHCPYCAEPLAKVPQRSGKCSKCGGTFSVNRKQLLFEQSLLTEEQAFDSSVFERLSSTYGWDVSRDTYDTVQAELTKRFGVEATWADVAWTVHEQLAERFARLGDFDDLSYVYASQAQILQHEFKDPGHAFHQQQLAMLRHFQKLRASRVEIEAGHESDDCPACKRLGGKIISLEDALANMPLPPTDCVCIDRAGFCTCHFIAIFD